MTTTFKEFEYYLVFMDNNYNYVMAYGYNHKPSILEFKYAIETLSNDEELIVAIPNFKNIIDYVCFDVMSHKKFIEYMVQQEDLMYSICDSKIKTKKKKINHD
jgi:hypothetical protein